MIFLKKPSNLQILLVFFCLTKFSLSGSSEGNLTHFISGGSPIDSHDLARFVVSIQLRSYRKSRLGWHHFCGGSIISPRKILTAAHCLYKRPGILFMPHEIVVVVGLRHRFTRSSGTRIKDVALLRTHRSFRRGRRLYADVGLLYLKEEIFFNNPHVAVIGLTKSRPVINKLCTVVGWGKLFDRGPTSDKILFVDVEIFSWRDCRRKYGSSFTPGMICAGYPEDWERDSCAGDSGGPLICDDVVVGIVSWGVGCGYMQLPGVYTDVYYFKNWLSNGWPLRAQLFLVVFIVTFLLFIENLK